MDDRSESLPERRRAAEDRLKILEALTTAFDHRAEVLAIIASAGDGDDARHALMNRFGFTDVQASAVSDLQLRRFARREQTWVMRERDELIATLARPAVHDAAPVDIDHPRADQPAGRPEWFQDLVRLMVDGDGTADTIAGVVLAHIPDDGGTTFDYRVARRGPLVRCASLDGKVHVIAGRDTIWLRRDGRPDLHAEPRRDRIYAPDGYEFGLQRPDEQDWFGDDFTRPTDLPTETTFLGRRAWEIELAPPPHKPHPVQIIVDAQTGLLLRRGNRAFGTFHEWIELDTDADLPDDLFVLHGADQPAQRFR